MGKTRRKKSFLDSSERISRNRAKGPSTFLSGQLHDSAIHWTGTLENSIADLSTLVSTLSNMDWIYSLFSAGLQEISKGNHLIRINHQNSIFKKLSHVSLYFSNWSCFLWLHKLRNSRPIITIRFSFVGNFYFLQ